jgi:DNA primase
MDSNQLQRSKDLDISYLQNRLDPEEILASLSIETASWKGNWLMCHCPNTNNHSNGDVNPSFGYNPDEMRYNCFVCGGGSLLELVSDRLDISEDEAINWLREHSSFEPAKQESLIEKIDKIIHPPYEQVFMPEYPADSLFQYQFIHPYLLDRGITKDVIMEQQVGYDKDHLGIVIPHWWQGKLVGWQVRHLLSEKVNGKDKYYCPTCGDDNSPTTAKTLKETAKYNNTNHFPKKETLYNYDKVVSEGHTDVVLVESPMTVLYMMSNGYRNVIATFGAWNTEQVPHLTRFSNVYLWPDNDSAGKKNLERVVPIIEKLTQVKLVPVVEKEKGDAADLSAEEIEKHLQNAQNLAIVRLQERLLRT